jgi:hypothetical protein
MLGAGALSPSIGNKAPYQPPSREVPSVLSGLGGRCGLETRL